MDSAGEGNMNLTLRVTLDTRSIVLKQSIPYVARYPDIAAPIERIGVEADFYRVIAGSMDLCQHTPEVLGFDPVNHLLCLEDLGPASDCTDLYNRKRDNCDEMKSLMNVISWLSALHGLSNLDEHLPGGLDNRAMRELNHAHIFEIPLTPDNGLNLDPGLDPVAKHFAHDEALKERASTLGQIYLGREVPDCAQVLLHGDFYPGSWLKYPPDEIKIIDPEFAFIGPREFDVGVLCGHLIMCGYDGSQLTKLLDNYAGPPGFSQPLADAFAGIEIIRRLLGVAQLPLSASVETKINWLHAARQMVLG